MPAGERVALEPALAEVLGQHLHHPAVGRDVIVASGRASMQAAVLDLEHGAEPVAVRLVGTEQPEVRASGFVRVDVAQQLTERAGGLVRCSRPGAVDRRRRSRAKSGRSSGGQQPAAVGVRVRAHAQVARRGQRGQLGDEPAVLVEELARAGSCAATASSMRQVLRVLAHAGQRHLVGAEGSLDWTPSTTFGPVQPFGVRSTIAGQRGRARVAAPRARAASWIARIALVRTRRGPPRSRGAPAAGRRPRRTPARSRGPRAARGRRSSLGAPEHRRAGDLVAVEVQDRQHGAVARAG